MAERGFERSDQAGSDPMPLKVSVEQFTEVTFAAVMRAIEARQFPHGPIIYGIIYLPQGLGEARISGLAGSNPMPG